MSKQEDKKELNSLRPQLLKDYIGQQEIKEMLSVHIKSALMRDDALPHMVFHGGAGLGKTSIARIIANEMGSNIHTVVGTSIKKLHEAVATLMAIKEGDILFIDEIHRMKEEIQEVYYSAMEDYSIDIISNEEVYNIPLPKFTLVGATTKLSDLSKPMRERFVNSFKMSDYTVEDLKTILKKSSKKLNLTISEEAALDISKRSRGIPRKANNFLLKVRDFAVVQDKGEIGETLTKKVFDLYGVDGFGLEETEAKVIKSMHTTFNKKPVGIKALASTTDETVNDIENVIEPFLLKLNLIKRTPRGRELTEEGIKYAESLKE